MNKQKISSNIQDLKFSQGKDGEIIFKGDISKETLWGNLHQISELFGVQIPAVSKHLKKIYSEGELSRDATLSILETVQQEGGRTVRRKIEYYNLDAIISVGYRINSNQATRFRIWATQTLKSHLLDGYTINKNRILHNYTQFMEAVTKIKQLTSSDAYAKPEDVIELISAFASTWMSLDAYDTETFPTKGMTKANITFSGIELKTALGSLKEDLFAKKQASELFGQEKYEGSIEGIVGNIFQTFGGKDLYPTIEEKAAHLLYFVVKNHPFNDGNKRCGAFSFIWFLKKSNLSRPGLTPEALTALTLLVAESAAKDKDKVIGLILLLMT